MIGCVANTAAIHSMNASIAPGSIPLHDHVHLPASSGSSAMVQISNSLLTSVLPQVTRDVALDYSHVKHLTEATKVDQVKSSAFAHGSAIMEWVR